MYRQEILVSRPTHTPLHGHKLLNLFGTFVMFLIAILAMFS